MIPRVEILQMASNIASKMAASNALKANLINKHDKKAFNFDFSWLFRGLIMIQMIKLVLVQKVQMFKIVSMMAAI